MLTGIRWLGHATVEIEISGIRVFVDPYQVQKPKSADLVLITHSHFDHLSPQDIEKVRVDQSVMVAPPDCAKELGPQTLLAKEGQTLEPRTGVRVEVYPSYNIGKKFHPKANGWVGYVIEIDGKRIYVAGDTDRIPEMKKVRCHIAFLPIGGTYTMNVDEAAAAVEDINPEIAIPIHWGTIVGTRQDAERFVQVVGDKARLLSPD